MSKYVHMRACMYICTAIDLLYITYDPYILFVLLYIYLLYLTTLNMNY